MDLFIAKARCINNQHHIVLFRALAWKQGTLNRGTSPLN